MAKVLLLDLDSKIPNIALMRVSAHHRDLGDEVSLEKAGNKPSLEALPLGEYDKVYASAIFERTKPLCEDLLAIRPDAVVGGSGWAVDSALEEHGIFTKAQDYSVYPNWTQSIGFTQRGCRLKCSFCIVPRKEGQVREESTISGIWRGDPWPRHILLLDNDFFGQPRWRERIDELKDGKFRVSFNQGINCRMITEESAAAIASVDYRDDSMKTRRVYTAWDNTRDEGRLMKGLELLIQAGVKPDHIMVYMLIGFWKWEDEWDWEYRRARLREVGVRPYPMPYVRNKQTVGFQRFVIGAYDKRFNWNQWSAANYRPEKMGPVLAGEVPVMEMPDLSGRRPKKVELDIVS